MKHKTTRAINKAKKNRALVAGPNYRYAGIISARMALKAGEHKGINTHNQRSFMSYLCPGCNVDKAVSDFDKLFRGGRVCG